MIYNFRLSFNEIFNSKFAGISRNVNLDVSENTDGCRDLQTFTFAKFKNLQNLN